MIHYFFSLNLLHLSYPRGHISKAYREGRQILEYLRKVWNRLSINAAPRGTVSDFMAFGKYEVSAW